MNNIPRQMLARITAKYGKEICSDARRCESLLNDLCGAYRREINVLVNAVEERVPLDLLAGAASMPLELLLTRLEKRLEQQTALTADASRWAVESWALALGAATDAQIEQRARKNAAPSLPKTETVIPLQPENKPASQNALNNNRANPTAPPKTPPPPKTVPPLNRQPTINPFPSPAPPVRLPVNTQPHVPAPTANQPIQPANSPTAAKRGFGIFRGCLLLIVFLVVAVAALVFVAPYALETMRETQRERNNEPPRFPVR